MSAAEKKRLARKIKITKSRVSKAKREHDRQKMGLSTGDMKMLERNSSKVKKQIGDSKVEKIGFDKTSNFFSKMAKATS